MILLSLASHATLALLPPQEPATATDEARAVLAEMRRALGPAPAPGETLVAHASAGWVGLPGEGKVTETYAGLRKAYVVTEFDGFGKFEYGTNGEGVWERTPQGVVARDGWDACEFMRRFGRTQLVAWDEMYSAAKIVGEEELKGQRCVKLELTPRPLVAFDDMGEAPIDTLWLDLSTHLPVQVDARARAMDGNEATIHVRTSDWRKVGERMRPFHKEVEVSGFTLLLDYKSFEEGVELPPDRFEVDDELRKELAKARERAAAERAGQVVVEELEARHIASIRVEAPHAELQKTLAVLLPETMQHVFAKGAQMSGPPLVIYHSFGDTVDLEAAMPLTDAIEEGGRVKARMLPAGPAVVAWHVGPYEELGRTHERIAAYMEAEGLERREAPWEEYWTDPGMEPDSSKWRTRVVTPVRKRTSD